MDFFHFTLQIYCTKRIEGRDGGEMFKAERHLDSESRIQRILHSGLQGAVGVSHQ